MSFLTDESELRIAIYGIFVAVDAVCISHYEIIPHSLLLLLQFVNAVAQAEAQLYCSIQSEAQSSCESLFVDELSRAVPELRANRKNFAEVLHKVCEFQRQCFMPYKVLRFVCKHIFCVFCVASVPIYFYFPGTSTPTSTGYMINGHCVERLMWG